jgi:dTDP-4-dehydrorhamnose reductase
MRLVVTGASGFLGLTLALMARDRAHEVTAFYCQHRISVPSVKCVRLDLEDESAVGNLLQRLQPEWILHCAAATNVDWCQDHPEQARALNVDVPRRLAAVARRVGARLLYVSTDAVFDGNRGGYAEEDECGPLNVYAASKLAGETAVRAALSSALIVRTNMFGWKQSGAPSLAEWIMLELSAGKSVPGFTDVVFTPLLVNDLSEIMLEMMKQRLEGVYHVASAGPCSKHDFACLIARAFRLREELIRPVAVGQATLRAPRPRNTALRTDKVVTALGRPMPDVPEAVQRLRALWDSGFAEELKRMHGGLSHAKV